MRIGFNPNKDKLIDATDFFHQVIIPVYIPNFEGYFKDSLPIFKYCLESLFKTCHTKTYFTIVNNGSCKEVVSYLNTLYLEGKIHEIIHTSAIGKLNAILKGLTGQNFKLITITDADVLFLNNWQEETYKIFNNFPKAGVVSTTPSSKMIRYLTSNVLLELGLSKKLYFSKVLNPKAMISFAKSIGNSEFYNNYHLNEYLSLSKNNIKAVIGAGHFVATYNSFVFEGMLNTKFSNHKLGSMLKNFLDKPVVKKGYWRLSTEDNYTYHMGNTKEDWMIEYINSIEDASTLQISQPTLYKVKSNKYFNFIIVEILSRIFAVNFFWIWFLRFKGLTKEAAKNY